MPLTPERELPPQAVAGLEDRDPEIVRMLIDTTEPGDSAVGLPLMANGKLVWVSRADAEAWLQQKAAEAEKREANRLMWSLAVIGAAGVAAGIVAAIGAWPGIRW